MLNNRFNSLNDDFMNKKINHSEDFFKCIAQLLKMDNISDTSYGTLIADKYIFDSKKAVETKSSKDFMTTLNTNDFTSQLKVALEECFNGVILSDDLSTLIYVAPDKTTFMVNITKLQNHKGDL